MELMENIGVHVDTGKYVEGKVVEINFKQFALVHVYLIQCKRSFVVISQHMFADSHKYNFIGKTTNKVKALEMLYK